MKEKKRDGSGRFSRSVDDADVLGAVRAHDPAATSEIAEEVGISRQGADRRLRSLREDGAVSSKKIGASLVWFIPRERGEWADQFDTDDLRGDAATTLDDTDGEHAATTAGATDVTETTAEGQNAESGRARDESDAIDRDEWRDRLAEEVAGSGDLAERRADAILTMYDHLREEGDAEKDELLAVIDPAVVEYAGASSVWSNMVKGRDTLRALPGVEKPASGRNKPWRFDP